MSFALLALLAPLSSLAVVAGDATVYVSPNGVAEQCIRLQRIPGGTFTPKDDKAEAALCSIDIYRDEVAACPKTWSTSAGTMLYSTVGSGLSQAKYEATRCAGKGDQKKLGKFKNTMNQSNTSGTFSQASLLYYQFSRYFNTIVQVPVSVYRSFDKDTHYERVSSKGKGQGAMNRAAWEYMRRAEKKPSSYSPVRELFTPDLKQIYGIIVDSDGGERYGVEINGVRSSWGDAQNNDFQQTPAFRALRSEKDFSGAVTEAIAGAKGDFVGALPLSKLQMGLWMRELTEITLLDYIFSQQDRIGNIDYNWYWVYVENGQIRAQEEKRAGIKDLSRQSKGIRGISAPVEIAAYSPTLVQKTVISDNDAGGRVPYTNFTKRTKMLEKIRHYDEVVYKRLMDMDRDFRGQGPLYQYVRDTFYLDKGQLAQVVKNTAEAASILRGLCAAGKLRFDLNFDEIVLSGGAVRGEALVNDCANP